MSMNVKVEQFEGPLDLLLHLITKNEIDINDIPITLITSQYLEYIYQMEEFNLDISSEFLVMASTLLEIKSKMLLPENEFVDDVFEYDGQDPREGLVMKLIEYKRFKDASEFFKVREGIYNKNMFKEQSDLEQYSKKLSAEELNKGLETDMLIEAVQKVLKRINNKDRGREGFFEKLARDLYTVEEKIFIIQKHLTESSRLSFVDLFSEEPTKQEVIVSFLAVLELLKLKEIRIVQKSLFDDIVIEKKENVEVI